MKVFFRNVHLYLALAAGLLIMMSCITGAILVFEDELNQQLHHERYTVQPRGERLPLQELVNTALKSEGKAKLASVKVYTDPARSVEVAVVKKKKDTKGKSAKKDKSAKKAGEKEKAPKPDVYVYVNPYTGKVIDAYKVQDSFFWQVEQLHRFLLAGPNSIGKTIVGLSTLSFLIITVTGIVLWWPKNKKILMQRLKFKTDGSFKRVNHDLHVVTGFYTSVLMIVIITTGLTMVFSWASSGIYALTGTSPKVPEPPQSVYQEGKKAASLDVVMSSIDLRTKPIEFYNIRVPRDSMGIFTVQVLPEGRLETGVDVYYADQYSGAVKGSLLYADKNAGQKAKTYMRPVHTGEVFGLPTKILNFILCLLTFSFPITGVIMWLNRIKKSKNKKPKHKKLKTAAA